MNVNEFIKSWTNEFTDRYLGLLETEKLPSGDYYHSDPSSLIPKADHQFTIGPYMISRPYELSNESLFDLLAWANTHHLQVTIQGHSSWFTETFLVKCYRMGFRKEFEDSCERHGEAFSKLVHGQIQQEIHGAVHQIMQSGLGGHPFETGIYVHETSVSSHASVPSDTSLPLDMVLQLKKGFTFLSH